MGRFYIDSTFFRFRNGYKQTNGFMAVPDLPGPLPLVIVAHDTAGLNDQIQGLVYRLAAQGFIAMSPDFYSVKVARRTGGGSYLQGTFSKAESPDLICTDDVIKGLEFMHDPELGLNIGRAAVLGLGYGGTIAMLAAATSREFSAAINFYGDISYPVTNSRTKPTSPLTMVPLINCPFLSFYGAPSDEIGRDDVAQLEQTLRAKGKVYDIRIYPGAPNGFFNEADPVNYRADVARDAFVRTLNFLDRFVKNVEPAQVAAAL